MDQSSISKDLIASFGKNYRILPLYELAIADHQFKQQGSLQQNKDLASKWKEFKDNKNKKRKTFDLPHVSDFHFYHQYNRYKPSESLNKRTDFRYSLVPGPGADAYGAIPIPSDFCSRSTVAKSNRKYAVLIKRKPKKA